MQVRANRVSISSRTMVGSTVVLFLMLLTQQVFAQDLGNVHGAIVSSVSAQTRIALTDGPKSECERTLLTTSVVVVCKIVDAKVSVLTVDGWVDFPTNRYSYIRSWYKGVSTEKYTYHFDWSQDVGGFKVEASAYLAIIDSDANDRWRGYLDIADLDIRDQVQLVAGSVH